jgi:hypothetical protein
MSEHLQTSMPIHLSFFQARLERNEARAQELQSLVYAGTRHPDLTIELQRLEALINSDLEVLDEMARGGN